MKDLSLHHKLVAVENDGGEIVPKIKVSENTTKITNPHFKKVYRYFDKDSGKAIADELCIYDEVVDDSKPRTIFDPNAVWKTKMLDNYTAKELLVPIFKTASACMSHRQLRKSQPIAVSRLTFSGTRLSVLKIRITIMLTSQRNSMTSRLFCSISMKSDF